MVLLLVILVLLLLLLPVTFQNDIQRHDHVVHLFLCAFHLLHFTSSVGVRLVVHNNRVIVMNGVAYVMFHILNI